MMLSCMYYTAMAIHPPGVVGLSFDAVIDCTIHSVRRWPSASLHPCIPAGPAVDAMPRLC